jgi:hypothetical protein
MPSSNQSKLIHIGHMYVQDNLHFSWHQPPKAVVSTPTSYSGGPGFDSRPRRPAILIEIFRGFSQSLQENTGRVP